MFGMSQFVGCPPYKNGMWWAIQAFLPFVPENHYKGSDDENLPARVSFFAHFPNF